MEENNKSGFTAEGRKLRPRRPRISGKVYSSSEGPAERRSYGEHSERRSGGFRGHDNSEGHGFDRSEGRSYSSEGRSYSSERRTYGHSDERRGSSEGRSYGNSGRRSYGQSEGRGYGNSERRSSYGSSEGRNFGPSGRRAYTGENGYRSDNAGRNYGEDHRSSSEGRNYGAPARRGYGQSSEGRSYGNSERKSSYGSSEGRNFGPSGRRAYTGEGRKPFGTRDSRPGSGRPAGKGFQRNAKGGSRPNTRKVNPYSFNETDEQNINIMLSKRPQLDQMGLSDNDNVQSPIKEVIRLNKFIANSGICSRREADQYIQAGVVTVNGEVVTELGSKVNVMNDDIRFNGERIRGEEKVYIVMNKPKGFVTTASDPHAEKTVMDLLKNCKARVFPVGRLDKNTTGVLMFTNDGEIAERLTHPSYDKKKIYQVILDKPLAEEDYNKVVAGITLSDGDIKADELEYIDPEDKRKLGIEIHSGKNRIVRRIFESLGYDVKALDRVYFAGLTKKGLKKGEWRYLSESEANVLRMGAYV